MNLRSVRRRLTESKIDYELPSKEVLGKLRRLLDRLREKRFILLKMLGKN